jgi:hypothetical protein
MEIHKMGSNHLVISHEEKQIAIVDFQNRETPVVSTKILTFSQLKEIVNIIEKSLVKVNGTGVHRPIFKSFVSTIFDIIVIRPWHSTIRLILYHCPTVNLIITK